MSVRRVLATFASCGLLTGACDQADQGMSAFFCQGVPGPGSSSASAAMRTLPDGRVQFAISKWQENGHHFFLNGIARRDGDHWVYEEFGNASNLGEEEQPHRSDRTNNATPTCKVTIYWPRADTLSVLVDSRIGCEDHHGRGFGWLSSAFTAEDYDGAVQVEFESGDFSRLGLRCNEPAARHGPVQVVR